MAYSYPAFADFGPTKTGLTGTIGYQLYNSDGTTSGSRVTAGISEQGSTGIYHVQLSLTEGWEGSIRWDTGGASPVYAIESVVVPKVDVQKWRGAVPGELADTDKLQCSVQHIAASYDYTLLDFVMLEEAKRQGYRDGIDVIVPYAATPADRGTALLAAYATAKARTPYGSAISATNQVNVYLPPWWYDVGASTLELDTSYINLLATHPESGSKRMPVDIDAYNGSTLLNGFRPSRTVIYSETADTTVIEQSSPAIRCEGFTVAQLSGDSSGSYHAYYVSADSNYGSHYRNMYFWHKAPFHLDADNARMPIAFKKHVSGVWQTCLSNGYAWRIGYDAEDEGKFSATIYETEAGAFSFIGDYISGSKGTHKAEKCLMVRASSVGGITTPMSTEGSGFGAFAGCITFANDIDDSCVFVDCFMGDNSAGCGAVNQGTWIRGIGGNNCQGSTVSDSYQGQFAGIDIDGAWGKGSLGGRKAGIGAYGTLSGTCYGSIVLGSELPHRLEGATIEDCLFTMGETNQDCVTLLDSNSKITNSTLLVVQGGTGISINAASALSVCAVGNSYNNLAASGQINGLGANVTNVGNPSTVTTDSASREASKNTASEIRTAVGLNAANLDTQLLGIGLKTNNLPASPAAVGSEMTLTAAYDAAKTAASSTALAAVQTHGDSTWATADVSGVATAESLAAVKTVVDTIATDTGETIPAAIAGIEGGGGTGTGARTVAIIVNDGTTALESASVRLTKGAETYVSSTNVSGQVSFSLDDGTWSVAITLAGYSFTPTTLVVDGDETQTYSMTLVTISASDPGFITGYWQCYDEDGVAEVGQTIQMRMKTCSGYGVIYDSKIRSEVSDSTGLATFTNLDPGMTYQVRRGESGKWINVTIPSTATSPYALQSIVGSDE